MDIGFLNTSSNNIISIAQAGMWAIAAIIILYMGASLAFGGHEHKERTKRQIPWFLIGAGIMAFGTQVLNLVKYIFGV